ncbi:uncharacterized protein ACBT57_000515 isoform 2-T2 [Dama dama]
MARAGRGPAPAAPGGALGKRTRGLARIGCEVAAGARRKVGSTGVTSVSAEDIRACREALCSQERPCQHIGLRKKDRGTVKSNSTDVWDDGSGRRRRSAARPCTGHVNFT